MGVTCLMFHAQPESNAAAWAAPASAAARYRQAGRAVRASPITPLRLRHRVCGDPGSWQERSENYESPRAKFAGRHYLAQIESGGLRKKWLPAISCNNAAPNVYWLPAEQAHETAARCSSSGFGRHHRADIAARALRSAFDFLRGFSSRLDRDRLRIGGPFGGVRCFLGQPQRL